MKKILIATTALVATAGVASADVSLSGDGRMGVVYDGNDLQFNSRIRASISLSGESDNGLSFGGSFDVHNASDASGGTSGSAFISGDFGKLSMGDVDGAAKAAVGNISGVGLTGLGDANELAYVNAGTDLDGNGRTDTVYPKPAALYEFSTGDFSFFLGSGSPAGGSLLVSDNGTFIPGDDTLLYSENSFSVGVGYSGDSFSIGLGYETADLNGSVDGGATFVRNNFRNLNQLVVGGSVDIGDFTVKANYAYLSGFLNGNQGGISGDWTADALTVTAFYAAKQNRGNNRDAYGLGVAYDLGGGLSAKAGVVDNYFNTTVADFGVSMSF